MTLRRQLVLSSILAALAMAPAVAQVPQPVPRPDSTPDSTRGKRAVRRLPLTPELEQSAFADQRARTLLLRAREARLAQDSALQSYEAKSFRRITVGLGVRSFERILLRAEQVARVRWTRDAGVWIEPTGRRGAAPMFGKAAVHVDMAAATPLPYFPGRESLWTPSSYANLAQVEVNEEDLLHPLATGAEAYYRYAVGDSVSFRLPDGRRVALRELRITARRPEWRAFVGSFWFDSDRGSLVRAAYRLATEVDLWQEMSEEAKRDAEKAMEEAERKQQETGVGVTISRALLNPLRGNITSITVEYSLHEGRFWLPRQNVAEGFAQAGFLRMPVKLEERYTYASVNADLQLARVPSPEEVGLAASDTSISGSLTVDASPGRPSADTTEATVRQREDSTIRALTVRADSLRLAADSARLAGDTASARQLTQRADRIVASNRRILGRRAACADGTTWISGVTTRFDGALRMAVTMPCDTSVLSHSADLPGTLFDPGEEVHSEADRDELLESLDFSLQPQWGPQPPRFHTGLDLLRYNRIEGLSLGANVTSSLGMGYSALLEARLGTADLVPNGELALMRTAGNRSLRAGVFHRLGVANDDWGAPLSFGASLSNAVYARDEGFYYRAFGAELAGRRDAPGPLGGATLDWRMFGERHRSAGTTPNVQASLSHLIGRPRFVENIDAAELTALGAGAALRRMFGADPSGFRLDARSRLEAAFMDRDDIGASGYGRLVLDGTLSRGLEGFSMALTGAAGGAAGELPVQRAFFMGGLHTVRGQYARVTGGPDEPRVGNAFWLARSEVARGLAGLRLIAFYDVGWTGLRQDLLSPGRPMSGAGLGVSVLDGLLRADLSRGIWPERRWRVDLQLGARF